MSRQLDERLKRRFIESPGETFNRRIISAASKVSQTLPPYFMDWVRVLFGEFMLPKPVYAFVVLFMLGISLGVGVDVVSFPLVADASEPLLMQDFLSVDEVLL